MPHARPHFGQGVIPTLPHFSWKVQMKGEHELQYVLGYTPLLALDCVLPASVEEAKLSVVAVFGRQHGFLAATLVEEVALAGEAGDDRAGNDHDPRDHGDLFLLGELAVRSRCLGWREPERARERGSDEEKL